MNNTNNQKYCVLSFIGLLLGFISILGFYYILYFFIGIIGLIISIIALKQIKKNNLKGKVFAVMGYTINLLTTLIFVILIGISFFLSDEISDIEKESCCMSSGGYMEDGKCINSNEASYNTCIENLDN